MTDISPHWTVTRRASGFSVSQAKKFVVLIFNAYINLFPLSLPLSLSLSVCLECVAGHRFSIATKPDQGETQPGQSQARHEQVRLESSPQYSRLSHLFR